MFKIILSFIFIVISIFLIFGYVKPTFDKVGVIKTNVAQYQKALNKTREIQELKRSLLAQYNLFAGGNMEKLKKLLPDHVDNVRLVLDIDGIASQHGIRISAVKTKKDADIQTDAQTGSIGFDQANQTIQPYNTLVLEFTTIATYADFKAFLKDLERSLRIVDLVSLEISPAQRPKMPTNPDGEEKPDEENLPSIYKFDVGIKTYWLKQTS